MHAAIVEFDPLSDAVRPASQDHDLLAIRRGGFTLVLVGRVEIGRMRLELGGTGIHSLVDRPYVQAMTQGTHFVLALAPEFRQALVREAHSLGLTQPGLTLARVCTAKVLLGAHDFLHAPEKPGIDPRAAMDLLHRNAPAHGLGNGPRAPGSGHVHRFEQLGIAVIIVRKFGCLQPSVADFKGSDCLLQALLEGSADRHNLADALHLCRQGAVRVGKFLEGKARDLGHDVVDAGLETRRGLPGDVVAHLVEGEAHCQLRRDFCDGEARGLGGQRRRTRNPRVHFDHHQGAILGIDTELDIGSPGIHTDLAHDRDCGVAHFLVFPIGQGLSRGDGD